MLSGFELYPRWVPLLNSGPQNCKSNSDHSATLPPLKNKRKVRLFVSWVFLTFGPVSGVVADTCSFSRWQVCAVYDVKRVCAITV